MGRRFTKPMKVMAVDRLSRGANVGGVCRQLKISRACFYEHTKKDAKFAEQVKDAQSVADSFVQDALFAEAARGLRADFECSKCKASNSVALPGGNVTAMIFWMKCRMGWNDRAGEQQDMVPMELFGEFLDKVIDAVNRYVTNDSEKQALVTQLSGSLDAAETTRKGQVH